MGHSPVCSKLNKWTKYSQSDVRDQHCTEAGHLHPGLPRVARIRAIPSAQTNAQFLKRTPVCPWWKKHSLNLLAWGGGGGAFNADGGGAVGGSGTTVCYHRTLAHRNASIEPDRQYHTSLLSARGFFGPCTY
jgi:hypothetical protein